MANVVPRGDQLRAWGQEVLVEAVLGDGVRGEVLRVRIDGTLTVARQSRHSPEALDWELDLLEHLDRQGFLVPTARRTLNGARRVGNLTVSRWIDGIEPSCNVDWERVAAELRRLHDVTVGWAQRAGMVTARELLTIEAGGDIDLRAMPAAAVQACRAAWAELPRPSAAHVIHGDPGVPNLRLTDRRIGILDWDEARVDHAWFDLADLPIPTLTTPDGRIAERAAHAWEAANGWQREPEYAQTRLAALLSEK